MKSGMSEPLQKSLELVFCISKTLSTSVTVKVFQKAAETQSCYSQVLQAKSYTALTLKLLTLCDHHSGFHKRSKKNEIKTNTVPSYAFQQSQKDRNCVEQRNSKVVY